MQRILIFDSNRVVAKKITKVISELVDNITIDMAENIYVLQDRLDKNSYDLIIADVETAADSELALEYLHATKARVVLWTMIPDSTEKGHLSGFIDAIMLAKKPSNMSEFRKSISNIVSNTCT